MRKGILISATLAITMVAIANCDVASRWNKEEEYFLIQNMAILASIDYEFDTGLFASESEHRRKGHAPHLPRYLINAFYDIPIIIEEGDIPVTNEHSSPTRPHKFIVQDLWNNHDVLLTWEKWQNFRYEASRKNTGHDLNIYERKDWKTINALVSDCNEWMKSEGRLACEFDGGSDYGMKLYTTILFNVAYLKYQEQKLGYRNGKYELISDAEPAIVLDMDSLLSRNAIARVVSYRLLMQTSSLLAENFKKTGRKLPVDEWIWSRPLGYDYLNKYYVRKLGEWEKFAKAACRTKITFSKTGFEAKDTETGKKTTFPRDDDLLKEGLKELNFYKEKCDFVNYFQIENYPMFLLSILRLYDVNLELDKATNKYVLTPGPTDPERFFKIVAEFTFVDDPSDTEYLKQNLKSWTN